MSDHLEPETSDRGLRYMPPLTQRDGSAIEVHESSAADRPHIWLGAKEPATPRSERLIEVLVHLTVEDARKLAEQLTWLCDNHYQLGGDDGD